jgi:hypothetical protein
MDELLSVAKDDWRAEADSIGEFFAKFGDRLPAEMSRQRAELGRGRLHGRYARFRNDRRDHRQGRRGAA